MSEVPAIVGSLEPEIKSRALDTYYSVVMREAPEFMKKLEATITRMLARGRIRTEHEYHLARAVIDANRTNPPSERDRELTRIVDEYDA